MPQLALFTGHYRCHNCAREVECVRRTRRFRLCDSCWEAVMPDWEQSEINRNGQQRDPAWYAETEPQRDAIRRYWEWYGEMEKRYPARHTRPSGATKYLSWRGAQPPFESDAYWPLCACGNRRQEMTIFAGPPGLFGGPFRSLCPICEGKTQLATLLNMAAHIHPEWDDEDWLDALSKSHPHLFDLGILPDGWYETLDHSSRQPHHR